MHIWPVSLGSSIAFKLYVSMGAEQLSFQPIFASAAKAQESSLFFAACFTPSCQMQNQWKVVGD